MTNENLMKNGNKIDSITIRQDLEKFNFSTAVFFIAWMALEVVPHNLIGVIAGILIAVYGIYHGMKMMLYLYKLDFIFMGQFIRDAENIAKWIVNRFKKPGQYDQQI